jgi:hypothetical protein
LAKRFAKSMNARLGKLELQSGESLRQRFLRRNAGGGHTVEAEIGDVMHGTYKMYARANEDLHPGWRQNGKEPDSVARSGEYVDLKPDTPSGRSEGAEKALDYQHTLKRETAILLYAIPRRHARRIRELKKRIKKANAEKVK